MTTSTPTSNRPETTRQRRSRLRRSLAIAAVGGLLASGIAGSTASAAVPATSDVSTVLTAASYHGRYGSGPQGGSSSGGSTATVDSSPATTAQEKGVVLIDTVLDNGAAAGTGIVLTSDGEVLTNYHVVGDSTSIQVTVATTGKTYTAKVVGSDEAADIALLQLKDASGLAVSLIDDDTVQVGDDVTAIGNAGGTGELTAAEGEVSALSTKLTTESEGSDPGETLKGLIETTSDVVAGDSGGPLVDTEGEVVGIDTAASTGTEIDGYAIPIDSALAVVTQIRDGRETAAVRIGPAAFLGVEVLPSTTATDGYLGGDTAASSAAGATIAGVVDGGAADQAGLTAGDTITELGSTTVTDAADLTTALGTRDPGDKLKVTWTTTDGQTESAEVTLGTSPVN